MGYRFKCENDVIHVSIWSDNHDYVSVDDIKRNRCMDRTIRTDKKGKFFTWNKEKIYLDNWIRTSMKEFKQKIENNGHVTSYDLCCAILSDGVENVRFTVPFRTVNISVPGFCSLLNTDETKDVLCRIEEGFNREVKNHYKIQLVPVEKDEIIVNKEDYYISSFLGFIKKGLIKIVV